MAVLPVITIQWVNGDDSGTINDQLGFTFLLYGYFIGNNPIFWQRILTNHRPLLCCYCLCYAVLLIFYNMVWLTADQDTSLLLRVFGSLILSVSRVIGVLTVLSLAYKYLNRSSKKLTYLNEAVYPYYIVHQSIIIVVASEISALSLGPIIEPIVVIFVTFFGCFLSFEIIKRAEFLRPLFGLKLAGNYSPRVQNILYVLSAIIIMPLALEIIF